MTAVIIIFNLFFCLALALYLRRRIDRSLQSGSAREEIRSLVAAFNAQADRNILILEERIKEARILTAACDKRILAIRGLMKKSAPLNPEKIPAVPRINIEPVAGYFEAKAEASFGNMNPEEKIIYLHGKKYSPARIAKTLRRSIDEINYYISASQVLASQDTEK
ncbi:MAG: hypothetical protein A2096_17400 [Spirochaetes bacterium GWF1_41_5]|nr:MAG: hypothetical protein A2096_17400 [Spirochaetes bacterium GWF1_41_5]HBE04206.1 hypothetical protein [Spirochaetia bacterium]